MKPKKALQDNTASLVRVLMESAVSLSHVNPALAKEQAALARKVRLRLNVRLPPDLARLSCHGCKTLLIPGQNARVRLGHGKTTIVRVTCTECGHVNRKILRRP